jgi:hypothetical protein
MTDLELVKRCAVKMGYTTITERAANAELDYGDMLIVKELDVGYNPLTDDAQAMALLVFLAKRGRIEIESDSFRLYSRNKPVKLLFSAPIREKELAEDLRKAIVECVARMP